MSSSKFQITPGEVLIGSSSLNADGNKVDRVNYFLQHLPENKLIQMSGLTRDDLKKNLAYHRERSSAYRKAWKEQPRLCIKNSWNEEELRANRILPLCIDIEVAAICDLACPFCHRQFIATPDKLIKEELCFSLIDQAADLGVPSIKFNLRGEPLLHPRLPEFISYAKNRGVLETGINTNATHLTEECAVKLIEAGLDLLIYSFDGGTKKTYEAMRPGRFRNNSFEAVYQNIKRFSEIRKEMGAFFPFTKIQMIMTKQTYPEIKEFFGLFSQCVDDVSVSQYQERGGSLETLSTKHKHLYEKALADGSIGAGTPFRVDADDTFYVSRSRVPCEQPFQRLTVTYEGRVGMCCIDWGVSHLVGYADCLAFDNDVHYKSVIDRVRDQKKGFDLLSEVRPMEVANDLQHETQDLESIWYGKAVQRVRESHYRNAVNDVNVCSKCTYVDTFDWEKIAH